VYVLMSLKLLLSSFVRITAMATMPIATIELNSTLLADHDVNMAFTYLYFCAVGNTVCIQPRSHQLLYRRLGSLAVMLPSSRSRYSLTHYTPALNVPTNGGFLQLGAIGSGKPRLATLPFLVFILPAGEDGRAITAPGLNLVVLRFVCVLLVAITSCQGTNQHSG
jgi:hypothetical protein